MQFVELKNPRVLDILERFRYLYREKYDITKTNQPLSDLLGRGEEFVSEEYLKKIMNTNNDGRPFAMYSYPIKPEHYHGDDPRYKEDFDEVNRDLKIELGLNCSTLSQLYPPKGFIDWHNNANAPSFNVLFTWSETGDGWFKWYDIENEKIITMKDKRGWSCKAGYFASYKEDKPIKYHCAYTDCWRMTLGFTLGFDKNYWEDMIDYIQCEE